jgi:hypothetical protein
VTNALGAGQQPGNTILYVHGRSFKPASHELLDISVAALRAGVERDYPDMLGVFHRMHKRIAYYADISNPFLEEIGERYDEKLDVGDRRNALQRLSAIEKRKNFGVSRYDRLPGKSALAEFAADLMAPVLSLLGLSKKLISRVAADLGEYWNEDSDFGSRIRDRVRTAICDATENGNRIMLITHGTGCVVAYDVLWQLSNDPQYAEQFEGRKVDLWLTVGAPLGDETIKRKLLGSGRKGLERFPSNIVSWYNVSAEDDFMCHDNTLADDFRQMLKQKQVSIIKDFRVYNLAVRYGKSNPHSSIGYLIHPRVAQIMVDWLRQGQSLPASRSISK